MASIEHRKDRGTVRVKWRHAGQQQGITVDSERDAKMLVKWLDRHGTRPDDDPDLLFALGRQPKRSMADPVTVGQAIEQMITRPVTGHDRPMTEGTRKAYRSRQRKLEPLHDMTVQGLSRLDVETFMAPLIETYAESTWRGVAIVLQTALRPYGKADLCKGFAGRTQGKREREPIVMTKATMDLIVALGHDHGIGDLLTLFADMGLRYGEAAAADREHVDLRHPDGPQYRVREQFPAVTTSRENMRAITVKTPRGQREVPMSPRLVELAESVPSGLLTTDGYSGSGPWRYSCARYRLGRLSRTAIAEGLVDRPLHFHDFRHSWGAHLLRNGTDIVTVSRLMGHSSVKITGDIYGHLTPEGVDHVRSLLK